MERGEGKGVGGVRRRGGGRRQRHADARVRDMKVHRGTRRGGREVPGDGCRLMSDGREGGGGSGKGCAPRPTRTRYASMNTKVFRETMEMWSVSLLISYIWSAEPTLRGERDVPTQGNRERDR